MKPIYRRGFTMGVSQSPYRDEALQSPKGFHEALIERSFAMGDSQSPSIEGASLWRLHEVPIERGLC